MSRITTLPTDKTEVTSLQFLNNLNIGLKLGLGFGVLVILIFAVGLLSLATTRIEDAAIKKANSIEAEVSLAERVWVEFLEARRSQQDFLLQYPVEGFETAFANYMIPHQERLQSLHNLLAEIRSLDDIEDVEHLGTLDEFEQAVLSYNALVGDIVDNLERRGNSNTGQMGVLIEGFENVARASAATGEFAIEAEARHTVEETLKYLLSPGPETIDATYRHAAALKTLIRSSELSATEKGNLLTQIDNSLVGFNQVVDLDVDIAADFDQLQLDANSVILLVERLIEEEHGKQAEVLTNLRVAEQLGQGVNVGFLVLAIIAGVVLAVIITRSITGPITRLTDTATRIAAGNLNANIDINRRDEIGQLATAFNNMTAELRDLIDSLEDRVEERTQTLEASAQISHRVTAILDIDELLQYVIDQIQTKFGFYHTHIYLLEEESGNLIMAEGYGQVGQQLKKQGHTLQVGEDIVGAVAGTNEHFLSNNVNEVVNFVRNPLLPDTNSELAVPLRKGGRVLGVLDIQSVDLNRFTPTDVSLIQSLANQVAVSIDNARLIRESQEAVQEVERLNRRLTRESWQEFGQEVETAGYRFVGGANTAIKPDSEAWLTSMKQAAVKKQLVKQTTAGNGDDSKTELAVPLMLRGEIIGVLGVKRRETSRWAEEEVSAVEAVANQVSRALENARLSKEQEKTIEQLKEVDRLKSEFLTSMSHELRTPLNSIIGFADVIIQGIDGDIPDMALNDIKLIHNSGQHLLALINDILDISKIEAGMMELVPEPLEIKESVAHVLAASSSLIKNKPVDILIDVEDEMPEVYADKLRLNQILLNLVSNSAKFTHEGSITIKARMREGVSDRMFVSVIDTGIGIPPDKVETIFDRFRQADASTTRQYGGTGLGLAICRQLVELHSGELKVASEENVGSEFYFTIPLAKVVED